MRIARRIAAWDALLVRAHAPSSWAVRLRSEQDASWLAAVRVAVVSLPLGGRLGLRAVRGRPAIRWHEAVDRARSMLASLPGGRG